jgi:hypothetical protein
MMLTATLAATPMMSMLIPQALTPATSKEEQESSSAYPISKFGGSSISGFKSHRKMHEAGNSLRSKSHNLFRKMVSGDKSSFVTQFGVGYDAYPVSWP